MTHLNRIKVVVLGSSKVGKSGKRSFLSWSESHVARARMSLILNKGSSGRLETLSETRLRSGNPRI